MEATDYVGGAVTAIQGIAADFGPQALIVLGVGAGIGLGVWAFKKLYRTFKGIA